MTLTYPSPRAFAKSLSLRRNAMAEALVMIVVEGISDKKALMPYLDINTNVIVSSSKNHSLGAYDEEDIQNMKNVLFFVDCDGAIHDRYKGNLGLILSSNRDIEADMIFELGSIDRMLNEYLSGTCDSPSDINRRSIQIFEYVRDLTSLFGTIIEAARTNEFRIKVRDEISKKMRRVRLLDLLDSSDCIISHDVPGRKRLTEEVGSILEWTEFQIEKTLSEVILQSKKECSKHSASACLECRARRYSNGHDIVDSIKIALRCRYDTDVSIGNISKELRISSQIDKVDDWSVAKRVRRWEESIGSSVFR